MGGIKVPQPELVFKQDYAGRKAGHRERFSPELAAQIVKAGAADYADAVENEPAKETKIKTSKKKKDEKTSDDPAV